MATKLVGYVLRNMNTTLREHSATVPLLGACFFSGSIGMFTMFYTSLRKSDVEFNRWTAQAYQPLKVAADEKWYVAKSSKDAYQCDTKELQELLNEVYEDGRYLTKH